MVGDKEIDLDVKETGLISDKGWSLYVNAFGDADPCYLGKTHLMMPITPGLLLLTHVVEPGGIVISQGVPWRNGVVKHQIVDGPNPPNLVSFEEGTWRVKQTSGDFASLRCASPALFGKPLIGERGDSFVVTLRLHRLDPLRKPETVMADTRRTGFSELWCARYFADQTLPCQHPTRLEEPLELAPGWTTLLLSLFSQRESHGALIQLLIRGIDCCFRCAAT